MHRRAPREPEVPSGDPAERAREIALKVLSGAPRSSAQLRDALLSRGVSEPDADVVIARYREVGLLDDAALAAAIVRARHGERGKARRAIRDELRRKGFEPEDIDAALSQISDEDERRAAAALARRRFEGLRQATPEARARRVVGTLARKGYAPGAAFALVRGLEDADIWDNQVGEAQLAEEE